MKRIFDLIFSLLGIFILIPLIFVVCLAIYFQDKHSPFYIAKRVGKNNKLFNMVKLRSMIVNADKSKVDSTSVNDIRITKVGKFIRKFKLDEIPQLYNVLKGEMSFVGPRPNVKRETNIYTEEEKKLLTINPGITDFASIVFSDEAEILKNSNNPDIFYNQTIRPWKSRLGLFYIKKQSLLIDVCIVSITIVNIFSRKFALNLLYKIFKKLNSPTNLSRIVLRKDHLYPLPPPGSKKIVDTREI